MATLLPITSSPRGPRTSRSRRTRFVCISDTHNCTVKLPKGDVLIHAGDLTNQGSYSELSKTIQWLEKADFEAKIVIAGNHDITLDHAFYAEHGANLHNQNPQDPERCLSLLTSSPTITYLNHAAATLRLSRPSGPQTTFTIFGSPYSPRNGLWAFGYDQEPSAESVIPSSPPPEAQAIWSAIPLDADILVTHTPAHKHLDESVSRRRAQGCEALRRAMWRVRPRLHVCGHVHEGRGAETVMWDIDGPGTNVAFAERGVEVWEDPGDGRKMSLVDLTGRKGCRSLENDGGHLEVVNEFAPGAAMGPREPVLRNNHEDNRREDESFEADHCCGLYLPPSVPEMPHGSCDEIPTSKQGDHSATTPGRGTFGLGLNPDTRRSPARSDMAALRGRMGRRETCVVNCAITATNWPHVGGRRFNRPIVVDLDLPVWVWDKEEEDEAFGLVGNG